MEVGVDDMLVLFKKPALAEVQLCVGGREGFGGGPTVVRVFCEQVFHKGNGYVSTQG